MPIQEERPMYLLPPARSPTQDQLRSLESLYSSRSLSNNLINPTITINDNEEDYLEDYILMSKHLYSSTPTTNDRSILKRYVLVVIRNDRKCVVKVISNLTPKEWADTHHCELVKDFRLYGSIDPKERTEFVDCGEIDPIVFDEEEIIEDGPS